MDDHMGAEAMKAAVSGALRAAAGELGKGRPASYIPALANADPSHLAVAVTGLNGVTYSAGDSKERFTIQSISKVILLAAALHYAGFEQVFQRVGMEPTGDAFHSIVRLETGNTRPSNPMINAGAIAVTSCIPGGSAGERFEKVLHCARRLTDNPRLDFDADTFHSEYENGGKNYALAYMLEANHVIQGDVASHLEIYFKACSIFTNCEEISYFGAVLANGGVSPRTGERLIESMHVRAIRALMTTCGLYDYSGEFALRVGIPAKSGVGGGIVGVVPERMGIGTYCPALDAKGNSVCGLRAMEYLSDTLRLSLF